MIYIFVAKNLKIPHFMLLPIILNDSNYKLTQFSTEKINNLENLIIERDNKHFVNCLIRKKEIRLTPEEIIRQLYLMTLAVLFFYPPHPVRDASLQDAAVSPVFICSTERHIPNGMCPCQSNSRRQKRESCGRHGGIGTGDRFVGLWVV
jgi:hypothetical protein